MEIESANQKSSGKIAGILVTFFPSEVFFEKFIHYSKEVDHWFIIDNGSDAKTLKNLIKLENEYNKQITIIYNQKNEGLAKAQNDSVDLATNLGYTFFYLLDQDSFPSPESARNLKKVWEELNQNGIKVGWVGSQVLHPSGKVQKYWIMSDYFYKRIKFPKEQIMISQIATCISSGSLISKDVFLEMGGFEERFFIDYLDIEYCVRLRSFGYSIHIARDSRITHSLGDTERHSIAGLSVFPTGHSPLRRYFMMRNRIWTWKKHFWKFPGWFIVDFFNFLYDLFRILVFEKNSTNHIKALALGFKKGLFYDTEDLDFKKFPYSKE